MGEFFGRMGFGTLAHATRRLDQNEGTNFFNKLMRGRDDSKVAAELMWYFIEKVRRGDIQGAERMLEYIWDAGKSAGIGDLMTMAELTHFLLNNGGEFLNAAGR